MKRKNRVKNPIAHADGGVSEGKTFNRTGKTSTFPEIEPFIWDYGNIYDWSAKNSSELSVKSFALSKNHAERIKEYLARNLVYDAISFLMSYDLTIKANQEGILQYYNQYFKSYPFDYLNEMLITITNEDVNLKSYEQKTIDRIDLRKILFEKIINDTYKEKIKEIAEKVIKYQGGYYDPLTFQRANQKAHEEGQKQEDEEERNSEGDEPQIQQTNSPNYLLIGTGLLIALFLFKRSKK